MEGIIKYNVDWDNSKNILELEYQKINPIRDFAFRKKLIGIGVDGVGYGNISFRINSTNKFIISGSATGGKSKLDIIDYSKVISFNINNNYIRCVGGSIASSESLSHAAIYKAKKEINAVLHFHNNEIWKRNIDKIPTTDNYAEYGTPQMAISISKIIENENDTNGTIIMRNHQDGVIIYSEKIESLMKAVTDLLIL